MNNDELIEKWSNSGFFENDLSHEKKSVLSEWLEEKMSPLLKKRKKLDRKSFEARLRNVILSFRALKDKLNLPS